MNEFYYDFPKSYREIQQALYTFLEYSIFTYILWNAIKNKKFRKIILFLSLCFICFLIVFFVKAKPGRIDSIPVGVETILVFLFSFFYFKQIFNYNVTHYKYNDPNFLLVVGILLYLGSSFFFNILANNLSEQLNEYWYLTYIPEIIKNILFAIAITNYKYILKENAKDKNTSVPYLDMI